MLGWRSRQTKLQENNYPATLKEPCANRYLVGYRNTPQLIGACSSAWWCSLLCSRLDSNQRSSECKSDIQKPTERQEQIEEINGKPLDTIDICFPNPTLNYLEAWYGVATITTSGTYSQYSSILISFLVVPAGGLEPPSHPYEGYARNHLRYAGIGKALGSPTRISSYFRRRQFLQVPHLHPYEYWL